MTRCHACDEPAVDAFYRVAATPTSSISLVPDRQVAANWPMGEVDLGICAVCGFIQNSAFDQAHIDYTQPYEESQAASPTFRAFAADTARMLDERFDLRGKTLFDVGCGKAEWMALVCRLLDMRGLGIDPSYVPGRADPEDEARYEVLVEFFDESLTHLTGDLVSCRHTLEHIQDAKRFTRLLYESTLRTPGGGLFVEVPDSKRILTEGAYWDVYYEHCSYFTAGSLQSLLHRIGFRDVHVTLGYGDQYLLATARTDGEHRPGEPVEPLLLLAESFAERARSEVQRWRDTVDRVLESGRDVVVWGATSKAVGFMAAVARPVVAAVDINPAKHGSFLPGTGTPVIAPEDLAGMDPGLVVIMNPIYRDEIAADLDRVGVSATVVALGAD
jgi:hypothetical protein